MISTGVDRSVPGRWRRAVGDAGSAAIALVVAGLLLGCPIAGNSPDQSTPTEAEAGSAPSPRERPGTSSAASRLAARIWWNQEEVAASLALTSEQRRAADEALERYRAESRRQRERIAIAQQEFLARLEAGELQAARAVLDELSGLSARQATGQARLKLDVLSGLTEAQRVLVQRSYPHLLRQPWVRRAALGSGGRRAASGDERRSAREDPSPP